MVEYFAEQANKFENLQKMESEVIRSLTSNRTITDDDISIKAGRAVENEDRNRYSVSN